MLGKEKEREDYWNFSRDLYTHNIFSDKTIKVIHEEYIYDKTHSSKSKEDDFEL